MPADGRWDLTRRLKGSTCIQDTLFCNLKRRAQVTANPVCVKSY